MCACACVYVCVCVCACVCLCVCLWEWGVWGAGEPVDKRRMKKRLWSPGDQESRRAGCKAGASRPGDSGSCHEELHLGGGRGAPRRGHTLSLSRQKLRPTVNDTLPPSSRKFHREKNVS